MSRSSFSKAYEEIMNIYTIWTYSFDDGTELKLLGEVGFSIQDIVALEKLHGKCVIFHERIRR